MAGRHGTPRERLMRRITYVNGCWVWGGFIMPNGYGQINVDGKAVLTHRLSYELFREPIPEGKWLDHRDGICTTKACCNPWHLEAVDPPENTRRGSLGHRADLRTTCPNGHARTPENTRFYSGRQACKVCHRERERARRSKEG